ncbi:DUF2726 domain-containing protein [Cerasicoccus frondis]|uniref:DUF2726 domain-containing protein n=1 Tax=Cerasicoccus frondis TaxID=490090 RepID=UPI002852910D|nr:DUF2726 domain-containing protein [Cerasicoccus frondis]
MEIVVIILIVLAFGLLFGIVALGKRLENAAKESASIEESTSGIPENSIESRGTLLTEAEQVFYATLLQTVNGAYVVMAKVRLEDIAQVKKGIDRKIAFGLRNRIKSRHIDFVLCDQGTLALRACIELDDSSHAKADRQKRDEMVDAVLKQAGVYLVRVPWSPAYDTKQLYQQIFAHEAPVVGQGATIS